MTIQAITFDRHLREVREVADGVGTLGEPLGEGRHLADPESPRRLSWYSHWASPPATPIRTGVPGTSYDHVNNMCRLGRR